MKRRRLIHVFYFCGLSALITLLYKLVSRDNWKRPGGIFCVAALGAATHWSGIMLTILALIAVAKVSAKAGVVVYPIGRVVLKQKVTSRAAWGIVCGSSAMVLLSWS